MEFVKQFNEKTAKQVGLVTVSYTHLEVCRVQMAGKQKKVVRKKNASGADKAKNIRVLLICALAVLIVVAGVLAWIFITKGNEEANMSRDEIPVSYTHLDVYKRQWLH